ncbi:Mannose-6-phosphate isomerase type II C-terminal domain-containing protein [Candidatus Magnetomoraceae bacterium gMMP-1]
MIEKIIHNNKLLSVIIRDNYKSEGIEFFTPDTFSQQIAYINRAKDYVILPHVHNPIQRDVHYTQEVLMIKSGKVRVDYYDDDRNYFESRVLNQGDVVLLAYGGHGFKMLEDSEIIEVKQGPYAGEMDKVRFEPVTKDKIRTR